MTRWLQGFLLAVNIPLFTVFGLRALILWRRERSPRFRSLLLAAVFLAVVAVAGALFHAGTLAVEAELLTERTENAVLAPVQAAAAVMAVATGVSAWRAYRRVRQPLVRAEQVLIANAVTPLDVSVGELGLTARELEVLEIILDGGIGDAEIADRLFVSPATASSHVASIMRKAGAGSRRDLLTLMPPRRDDPR